jgi:hypothetical protein
MSPNQSKASGVPRGEAFANSLFMKGFFASAVGGDCPRTVSADDFGQLDIGWCGHARTQATPSAPSFEPRRRRY